MKVFNLGSYGNLNISISNKELFRAILSALIQIYDGAPATDAINKAAILHEVDSVAVDLHCRRFMQHNNLQSA